MRVIGVFGSVARGEDRAHSEIELPVRMGLLGLGRLQQAVEELLEASVDLVPETDLKPAVRPKVEADPTSAPGSGVGTGGSADRVERFSLRRCRILNGQVSWPG